MITIDIIPQTESCLRFRVSDTEIQIKNHPHPSSKSNTIFVSSQKKSNTQVS